MSKIIKIYCEGKQGSHDYDILQKVIGDLSVFIEPIGSIRGAGAIIQYKEKEVVKSDFFILFRDRDFDKPIPQMPILEQDNERKYCYWAYRNTIENYLFNPTDLYRFLVEQNKTDIYQINNENEAKQKLIEVAEKIKDYQAVRHAMGSMRTGESNFGTKWTEKSGILPESLEKEHCRIKALERINQAKQLTENWNEEGLNEKANEFLEQFNIDFMNRLDFLIWFQGKDFEAALQILLPSFPTKSYYKFAKNNFNYELFPDLVELRTLLQNKLK